MAKLEYRLYNDGGLYLTLYVYERIHEQEISLRFACDDFVKDGRADEKTSGAIEAGLYVIYVTEALEECALPSGRSKPFGRNEISSEMKENT